MTPLARAGIAAVALLGMMSGGALAAERTRRDRPRPGKALQQIEQQIRAGRSVIKRVQRDPRASAELKQQASRLDQILDSRERALAKLEAQHREFLARHQADLDALEDLRKRALAIDKRLGEARTALVQANRPELDELKRTSEEAREVIESLRNAYELDRRNRRQR